MRDGKPTETPPGDPETKLPEGPAEERSQMQQAVLDSGALSIDGFPIPAMKTNQGTIYLGSPADIARAQLADSYRKPGLRYLTDEEVDKLWGVD